MSKDFNYQQYQGNYKQYLDTNDNGQIGGNSPKERITFLAQYLPKGSRIFEIGSGGGNDAHELTESGYVVTASDYVEEFANILTEKGLNAVIFDAKNDTLPDTYDAVYANAVFVHFSPEEIAHFLTTTAPKLTGPRLIFATVIKGDGSERSTRSRGFERDFYYYSLESFTKLFEDNEFTVVGFNDSDPKWLQIIACVKEDIR